MKLLVSVIETWGLFCKTFYVIGLHHPLYGVTNPEYKLLRFIQVTIFLQREEGTSF